MPPSKQKPSEIAVEAKKTYIPWILQQFPNYPANSTICISDNFVFSPPAKRENTRFAFYDRDPVDLTIEWADGDRMLQIPVIMPANDKRPGGDWEAGVMSPEECLCRRSTLYAALTTPMEGNQTPSNYPIPARAGIYSPTVVVFRSGPQKYEVWEGPLKVLPVISVCPVKRPKLDNSDRKYSFEAEKDMMREKLKCALRIARYYGHIDLCIGNFGLGSGFRNPPEEIAKMWRDLLLKDPEFMDCFRDVVFAFEDPEGPGQHHSSSSKGSSSKSSSSKSSSSKSSSSKGSSSKSSSSSSSAASDLELFREVFNPSRIHGSSSRP